MVDFRCRSCGLEADVSKLIYDDHNDVDKCPNCFSDDIEILIDFSQENQNQNCMDDHEVRWK